MTAASQVIVTIATSKHSWTVLKVVPRLPPCAPQPWFAMSSSATGGPVLCSRLRTLPGAAVALNSSRMRKAIIRRGGQPTANRSGQRASVGSEGRQSNTNATDPPATHSRDGHPPLTLESLLVPHGKPARSRGD
jgi:hypothetical protein